MTAAEIDDLAGRLFAAIERGDIDAVARCYQPDVAVWHSPSGREQTREQNLALLSLLSRCCSDWRYEDVRREIFADGFVQQHVLRLRNARGVPVEIPVCIVVRLRDGAIARIDEYLDGAAAAPLFDGLEPG